MAPLLGRRRWALCRSWYAVRPGVEALEDRTVPAAVTEFPLGTAPPAPQGIVAGPDGNLWYTDPGANKVGRLTPTGAVTEFTLPTAASDPRGIAAGPDGALWFAGFGADRIGRIDPATGTITEFPLTLGASPADIVAGPDGNLWFTGSGAEQIGQITTAGVVTEFATPTAAAGPAGIAAGPDGAVWFTEAAIDQVGRVSAAGTITELGTGITAGAGLAGIVLGPGGNLWFGETTADQLGRVTLTADLTVTKTDGAATAVPGAAITYTIVVTNVGSDSVDRVRVTDAFAAALTGVTWTAVLAGGAASGTTGSGDLDELIDLPAGASVTYAVTATIDPAERGTLVNTATATSLIPDPTPGNNTATDTDTLTPQVDVRVTKTDGQTAVLPGTTVTYTVVVSNTGPSTAVGVILTDDVPAFLTGVTWTSVAAGGAGGNAASGSGDVNDTFTLPPGGSVTFSISGTVVPGTGTLINTAVATVPAGTTDTDSANNSVTDQTNVIIVDPPLPPVRLVGTQTFAAGPDRGGGPTVKSYNPDGTERFTAAVFDGAFTGGVRVAEADFNADGVTDLVVGPGPGVSTRVRVLDGATRAELFAVDPFEASFVGGVFVAAGDLDGDGRPDLVITPDEGGGPRCRIFSGNGFFQLADFFGIEDTAFRGGARAATGDVNGDGFADLLVAAGFGGGPRLAVFDGRSIPLGDTPVKLFGDFFVFEQTLRNGVYVATGDVNGDGFADAIAGGGPGGGPRVFALSGKDLVAGTQTQVANFFAGDTASRGGIRVTVKNLDGDLRADLVVGAGTGAGSRVTAYLGTDTPADGTPPERFAFDAFPGFAGGVFVG